MTGVRVFIRYSLVLGGNISSQMEKFHVYIYSPLKCILLIFRKRVNMIFMTFSNILNFTLFSPLYIHLQPIFQFTPYCVCILIFSSLLNLSLIPSTAQWSFYNFLASAITRGYLFISEDF